MNNLLEKIIIGEHIMSRSTVMFIVYIFELFISFCFYSRIYDRKKNLAITLLIGLLLFIPSSYIFNLFENEIINLTVFFLINVFYALICFEISFKNAVIQSVIMDALMYSTEIITIFLLSVVLKIPTNLYKNDVHQLILVVLICKLLYFILSQLLSMIIIKLGHKNDSIKQFLPLFIFPILTIASCTVFLYTALQTKVSTFYKIITTVICILYILASVFAFVYYQILANKERRINELESEKRMFELNKTYLDILEHQNNELQMHFHDTKNHYLTISGFEDISEVKEYISNIYPDLESKTIVNVSSNKIINLILGKYIVLCNKQGIKLSYELQTANLSYIDDSELSIILNNIMDNAVEAASQSEEKQIELSIRHINDMDLLSVINSCDTPPNVKGNRLITTKKDSNGHGFGTRIIKKHAALNNATYEWFYDEDEKQFHTNLIFNPNK